MPPVEFDEIAGDAFDEIKEAFRTTFTYQPKAGGIYDNLVGIFDNRAQEVDPDTEQPVSSNVYTLGVKLEDLPFSPAKGDKTIIGSFSYRVIDVLEDGVEGVSVVLVLHRVKAA